MAEKNAGERGKFDFIRQYLGRHPDARARELNEAWRSAGHPGDLSRSTISKVRTKLGLAGSPQAHGGHGKPSTRPAKSPPPAPSLPPAVVEARPAASENGAPTPPPPPGPARAPEAPDRARTLEELEAEIDRVLFRVMGLGEFPEIEEQIRRARRLLILASRH